MVSACCALTVRLHTSVSIITIIFLILHILLLRLTSGEAITPFNFAIILRRSHNDIHAKVEIVHGEKEFYDNYITLKCLRALRMPLSSTEVVT